jgi:hypothetical protein
MRTPPALLIGALTVLFTACTRVGSGRPVPVHRAPPSQATVSEPALPSHQDFEGRVGLGEQEFKVVLRVERMEGAGVQAVLRIPALGLEARGDGTATEDRLSLSLRYDAGCEGVLTIEARLSDGGLMGDGTLDAVDCTGRESGALALARLPEGALEGSPPPR